MNTTEIRPNNNLFYQPTCVVTVADNHCVYVDFYKCSADRKVKSLRFGKYVARVEDSKLSENKREAWEAVKVFMKGLGHTDLKTV